MIPIFIRFFYTVKLEVEVWDEKTQTSSLKALPIYSINTDGYVYVLTDTEEIQLGIDEAMPYLRPMSSMTKKEKDEYQKMFDNVCKNNNGVCDPKPLKKLFDFLYEHHLDFNGFIEEGIALEAPKGMYKIE